MTAMNVLSITFSIAESKYHHQQKLQAYKVDAKKEASYCAEKNITSGTEKSTNMTARIILVIPINNLKQRKPLCSVIDTKHRHFRSTHILVLQWVDLKCLCFVSIIEHNGFRCSRLLIGITNIILAVMLVDFSVPGVMFFSAQYRTMFFLASTL